MIAREILEEMRARYANAPSHVPAGVAPRPGTYCMITAFTGKSNTGEAYNTLDAYDAFVALRTAAGVDYTTVVKSSLVDYNATHSTEEVLAVFDKAIANVS